MAIVDKILVLAAVSQEALEADGASVDTDCGTIGEAKDRAKHYLTDAYARSAELNTPLGYSQVLVNGVCRYDYFR